MKNQETLLYKNNPIDIMKRNEGTWFRCRHICIILKIAKQHDYLIKNAGKENLKKYATKTNGGTQQVLYVNKDGLDKMIALSKSKYGVEFKNWLDCLTEKQDPNYVIDEIKSLSRSDIDKIYKSASAILQILDNKNLQNDDDDDENEREEEHEEHEDGYDEEKDDGWPKASGSTTIEIKSYTTQDIVKIFGFDTVSELFLYFESKKIMKKTLNGWCLTDHYSHFAQEFFYVCQGVKIKDFKWGCGVFLFDKMKF
ncbi:MAG: hypothetical protein EBX50_01510 [Chitinophagia bacterium]|nr:hypothetical protein [Chitinophagia bacterium]